jgi:hypothetical protein
MLKLLRNFALAGLLLAGAMKLLAWWAVGRDAERVVAALAPYAQVKYEGISAGLDGSVSLDKVSIDADHRVYRADSVVLEAPNLFWLLGHAFVGGNSLPAQFSVSADGLKLPPMPWLDSQFLDPATFVPFATVGCGSAFSDADYQRMGVSAPSPTHERLDYRYDADQHTLNLVLNLKAPGFAQVNLEADLKKYDAEGLASAAMWDKVHVDQLSADYTDLDFLGKRNRFCAQRVSSPNPEQFVERHIGGVQELLKTKRIEPSSELVQLYRALLEHGGHASVLSLPSSSFVVAAVHGASDDLLRQLNVTARYQDKPPIMFRLAFTPLPPEEVEAALSQATPAPTPPVATAPVVAAPAPPPSAPAATPAPPAGTTAKAGPTPTTPTATPSVTPAAPAPVAKAPPAVAATAPAPTAPPVTPAAVPTPAVSAPATPEPPVAAIKKPAQDNLGLHNLDREEAKLAAISPPLAPPKPQTKAARGADLPVSGSLESLVWKPSVFMPLPETEPEERNYDVIDYGRLNTAIGRYVQVITEGGRKIGGLVLSVDENGLKLQVNREGGNITFVVAKARVQEVRIPHY